MNKIAERITDFSGSLAFVYLHTLWFVVWFVLRLDINLLTLIVSLEAIYLSTFIMITQKRQEDKVELFAAQDEAHDAELDTDIDDIQEDVDDIQEDVDDIQEDVDDIQEDIDEIQEDIDDIQKQFLAVHKELAEIRNLLLQSMKKP